jgi:hypothetical protein
MSFSALIAPYQRLRALNHIFYYFFLKALKKILKAITVPTIAQIFNARIMRCFVLEADMTVLGVL